MSARMGRDGRIYVASTTGGSPSALGFIDSWTINRTVGMAEQTEYGDAWGSYIPTIKDWTANISGTLDTTNANQLLVRDQLEDGSLARQITCLFMASDSTAGEVWEGDAHIVNDSVQSNVKGKVAFSASLQGEGELSWSPAT